MTAAGKSGEGLRSDDRAAVHVPHRRRQLRRGEGVIEVAHPEFAHWQVGLRANLQRLEGARVRFDRGREPALVAQLAEAAVVVFRDQIGDRAAPVPEEAFGILRRLHHAAGERDHQRERVVAAATLKFLAELRRPVLPPDFVAVDQQGVEGAPAPRQRTEVVEHFLHVAVPVVVEGFGAHLVALQAAAALHRVTVLHAGGSVAETHDDPPARRGIPLQTAVRLEARSEFENAGARHGQFGRHGSGRGRGMRQRVAVDHATLGLVVLDAQGRAECDLRHVEARTAHRRHGEQAAPEASRDARGPEGKYERTAGAGSGKLEGPDIAERAAVVGHLDRATDIHVRNGEGERERAREERAVEFHLRVLGRAGVGQG